jgi:hypothetical protein
MHLKILKADLILVKSHRKFVDLEKKYEISLIFFPKIMLCFLSRA